MVAALFRIFKKNFLILYIALDDSDECRRNMSARTRVVRAAVLRCCIAYGANGLLQAILHYHPEF
jgi:hypothetical protein